MAAKPQEVDKDSRSSLALRGRFQQIPARPLEQFQRPTLAAGAVLWRYGTQSAQDQHIGQEAGSEAALEVAVIHRPHYDDWSLAKGKVDPGESIPVTAHREILEETGYEVRLGKLLGYVTYPVGDRTKVVYYWTAEVTGGSFTPNKEVDEIRWVSVEEAMRLLSYDVDREVLAKATKRLRTPVDATVLYVRHARAFRRHNWAGNDDRRPLDKKGRRQAEMLVSMLEAFQPEALYSALPDRCQQTVTPLSASLGLEVAVDERLGDHGWVGNMIESQRAFRSIIGRHRVSVVVGQGIVIPDTIAWLAASGQLPLDDIEAKKASTWVLSFADGKLVGADYLASPLPVK